MLDVWDAGGLGVMGRGVLGAVITTLVLGISDSAGGAIRIGSAIR